MRSGDTLQSVAQAAWGDANLWYLIAAANGPTGSEMLVTAPAAALNPPAKRNFFKDVGQVAPPASNPGPFRGG